MDCPRSLHAVLRNIPGSNILRTCATFEPLNPWVGSGVRRLLVAHTQTWDDGACWGRAGMAEEGDSGPQDSIVLEMIKELPNLGMW